MIYDMLILNPKTAKHSERATFQLITEILISITYEQISNVITKIMVKTKTETITLEFLDFIH